MIKIPKVLKIKLQILLIVFASNSYGLTFYDLGTSAVWPSGVNSNGSLVVGRRGGEPSSFKWTKEDGIQSLSLGGSYALAFNVSADGTTIVGGRLGNTPAFRVKDGNYQNIPFFSGQSSFSSFSWAYGVNSNGTSVVGEAAYDDGSRRAFFWNQDSGHIDIGTFSGSGWSTARSVSQNGTVVVGTSALASGTIASNRAFLWTQQGGLLNLGTLPGMNKSDALSVSGDGSTVVGYSEFWNDAAGGSDASRAFRWQNGAMQDLGILPGGNYSVANGANEDGSIIVGSSDSSNSTRAFIWNSTDGMIDLTSRLENLGLNLNGFILREAAAISSDSSTIVGYGTYDGDITMRGFVVTGVPEPSSLSLLLAGSAVLMAGRRRLKSFV